MKDFISDIEELDVKVDAQEKKKLNDLADVDGQVMDESKIGRHDIWFHSYQNLLSVTTVNLQNCSQASTRTAMELLAKLRSPASTRWPST